MNVIHHLGYSRISCDPVGFDQDLIRMPRESVNVEPACKIAQFKTRQLVHLNIDQGSPK